MHHHYNRYNKLQDTKKMTDAQSSLFPDYKKKPPPKIFQGNAITNARYDMSVLEKQLVYLVLAEIKREDRQAGKTDFTVRIKDLENYGQKLKNYTILRESTKKLVGRVYEIWTKDEHGKSVLIQTTLLSSAKYVSGSGTIQVTVSNEIKPYLMDLAKGFTSYSLDHALSLKSVYSQRLYECLSRFKDLGMWRCTVEELKYLLKIENKYTGYGMFKKKVLDVAQQELKRKTDISFEIEEYKEGRKIAMLLFNINPKETAKHFEIEFDEKAKIKNRLMQEFELTKWQAKDVATHVDEKEIIKELYKIKLKIVNNELDNIGGYTWKIFEGYCK